MLGGGLNENGVLKRDESEAGLLVPSSDEASSSTKYDLTKYETEYTLKIRAHFLLLPMLVVGNHESSFRTKTRI